jgi:hypothetical protein
MKDWFSGCIYCGILTLAPDDVCRSCTARLEMTTDREQTAETAIQVRRSPRLRAA